MDEKAPIGFPLFYGQIMFSMFHVSQTWNIKTFLHRYCGEVAKEDRGLSEGDGDGDNSN